MGCIQVTFVKPICCRETSSSDTTNATDPAFTDIAPTASDTSPDDAAGVSATQATAQKDEMITIPLAHVTPMFVSPTEPSQHKEEEEEAVLELLREEVT